MNFKKQQTSSSNIFNEVIEEPTPTPAPKSAPTPATAPVPVPSAFAAPKEDAINANEVSTEDSIIVPPPDIFGNDDNRVNEQPQQPQQLHQQQHEQQQQQPDVTGAASTPHQPDLIQDVAAKQGPGILLNQC